MNYIFFLLSNDYDAQFRIIMLSDELYTDLVYTFTNSQLELLYTLLEPYRVDTDSYDYFGARGLSELIECSNAEDMLRFLSWRNN